MSSNLTGATTDSNFCCSITNRTWPYGEIGKHAGFKLLCLTASRFKSEWGYSKFDFVFRIQYNMYMITCIACGEEHEESYFNWKNKAKGVRSKRCKTCTRADSASHYQANKKVYNDRAKKNRPVYYQKSKDYIVEYLRSHPCVDCGNDDIRVLQFDHRDMVGQQAKRVSEYMNSFGRMVKEIEKCDVRCANCHMIRTFEQLGWEHRGPVV